MDNMQNNNGHEHVEVDKQFLDMLAAKFTAKQLGQDKPDPTKAANSLAAMLSSFYKELRRGGVPRALSFKLTIALLHLTMQH
jgi:hypothetical protein